MTGLQQQLAARKEVRSAERKAASAQAQLDNCKKKNTALQTQVRNLKRAAERQHLRAIVSEQSAERVRSAVTEAAEMTADDIRLIRALDSEGIGLRDIAEKFETDLLTVACIVEGVA